MIQTPFTDTRSPYSPQAAIETLSALAAHDPGQRGFSSAAASAAELQAAAESLLNGHRIVIATGFCIRAALIGENDGLTGALAIADALARLGKEVVLVSDRFSSALLEAGAHLYDRVFPIVVLETAQDRADAQIAELLQTFKPTQVLAIERPGSAIDGHRYSMRGVLLDDLIPGADRLLVPAGARDFTTLAIGDGGNELGLGALRSKHMHRVEHGEKIFCATPADHVIAAGISNWGGHALVAALTCLSGQPLMRATSHEKSVLEALQAAGAVDGCTGRADLSVDGIDWADYSKTLEAMFQVAYASEHGA